MRPRSRLLVATIAVAAAVIALAVSVRDGEGDGVARPALVDGSRALPAPATLRLGEDAALARVRVLQAAVHGADVRACFRQAGLAEAVRSPVLELVGLQGRSLTFRVERGRGLVGCEASARMREARGGRWCGVAHGRLRDGRLRDDRLGMVNCLDADRRIVAFAWIEPAPGAAWLAVRNARATEVYRVVRGFPLRVTTTDVRAGRSSAVFDVAQFAADGRRIAARTIEMSVAG